MSNDRVFTFDSFLNSNSTRKLNSIDYVHAIFKLNELPIDFVFCLIQLISPEFKVVNGAIFLAEQFDLAEYKKYMSEGRSIKECQKWINLIEVTGLFDNSEIKKVIKLAHSTVNIWNFKLTHAIPNGSGVARVIYDEDIGEVFITID